jgi:hypothetical protein
MNPNEHAILTRFLFLLFEVEDVVLSLAETEKGSESVFFKTRRAPKTGPSHVYNRYANIHAAK